MFTADLSKGRALSADPGEGHSRAVPSGAYRARAPPTPATLTAWLAASAGKPRARPLHPAALEAACGRGAPDPQRPARAGRAARPHGVTSAAASPSRRYLAPSDPGIPARANHRGALAPPRLRSDQSLALAGPAWPRTGGLQKPPLGASTERVTEKRAESWEGKLSFPPYGLAFQLRNNVFPPSLVTGNCTSRHATISLVPKPPPFFSFSKTQFFLVALSVPGLAL